MTCDNALRASMAATFCLLGAWCMVLVLTAPGPLAVAVALAGPVASQLAGVHAYHQALTRKDGL